MRTQKRERPTPSVAAGHRPALPRWVEPALLAALLVFGTLPVLGFQVLGPWGVISAGLALLLTLALILLSARRSREE